MLFGFIKYVGYKWKVRKPNSLFDKECVWNG